MGAIGRCTVKATIKNDQLSACIMTEKSQKLTGLDYYFYLIKDGEIIDKAGWFKENSRTWKLREDGVYCVQGYVQNRNEKIFHLSAPIGYFKGAALESFEEFMKSPPQFEETYRDTLDFYDLKHPFADFLICTQQHLETGKEKYSPQLFLQNHKQFQLAADYSLGTQSICVLCNGGIRQLSSGKTLVFSGTTIYDNTFIMGAGDIPENVDFDKLAGGYGNYSCAMIGPQEIKTGTDYFCYSHFYYYDRDGLFVIANRYHLLLMFLKEIGVSLELDLKKAAVNLSTVDVHLLRYNFTRRMDVLNCFQLENDKTFVFHNDGWKKQLTEYGKDARIIEKYNEEQYCALLSEAKEEMIRNLSIVCSDSRFPRVLVDLSGGLDSRTAYAAATNLKPGEGRERLYIRSDDVPGSADISISTEINGIYQFKYDDLARSRKILPLKDSDQITRSFYMGISCAFNPFIKQETCEKCINLFGAGGEIQARPYMSRKYFGTAAEEISDAELFAEYLWGDVAVAPNIVAADEETHNDFVQLLSEELKQLPAEHPLEAYERVFLHYGNAYHCSEALRQEMRQPYWMPMQSKTLLRLHHMTFFQFKSIRLHLDLIYQLNPLLAGIRFDNPSNTESFQMLKSELIREDPRFLDIAIKGADGMKAWREANVRKEAAVQVISLAPEEEKRVQEEHQNKNEILYHSLLKNLYLLLRQYPELASRVGPGLHHYITNHQEKMKQLQYFYNKITSLLDQGRLIHGRG